MKKLPVILLALAAAAAGAYFACYHFATRETRRMLGSGDDMDWLRTEFRLSDEQAHAVKELQADYEPHCMEMCGRIAKSSERLSALVKTNTEMTPELDAVIREAAQTHADCQVATLRQAFAIGVQMAPEQAARYRTMVAGRIQARHDMCGHR